MHANLQYYLMRGKLLLHAVLLINHDFICVVKLFFLSPTFIYIYSPACLLVLVWTSMYLLVLVDFFFRSGGEVCLLTTQVLSLYTRSKMCWHGSNQGH